MPRLGQLVYSKAGRDRGRAMVVVGILDDRHVLVSDGEVHPMARPKRKNVRHLSAAQAVQAEVAGGQRPDDAVLRSWLASVAPAADMEPTEEDEG